MDELDAALAMERELREQISDLVHSRARAEQEAARLTSRLSLPGTHEAMREIAGRWERQASVLDEELAATRTSLRAAEAEVARLRAEEAGL